MLLHTEAFTQRCFDIYTPTHTEAFRHILSSENHRSFDTEKPLHRDFFTHRRFYTHKFFHRSFYTEKFLRTGTFTHRRLYTQKFVHTEAFTHRSFCTEKPLHRRFPTEKPIPQLLHASKNRNLNLSF